MLFPIISGIILIILIGIFLSKTKKEKIKEEVIPREKQPVIIELIPKGTSANPYKCSINSEVKLEVKGYSDYKKENEVILNDGYCSWHKSCQVGRFEKEYGITNIYYTSSARSLRTLWCDYNDGKLKTSARLMILEEV